MENWATEKQLKVADARTGSDARTGGSLYEDSGCSPPSHGREFSDFGLRGAALLTVLGRYPAMH